jgi:hypothetical protein
MGFIVYFLSDFWFEIYFKANYQLKKTSVLRRNLKKLRKITFLKLLNL